MFYKSKEIIHNDRTFLIKFRPYWEGKMCECKLYELVRPNWKLFKYKFLDIYYFWVEEYKSIPDGLHKMLSNYISRETFDTTLRTMWDNI